MIKILFLDLGETLVHGNSPFPGVPEALEAVNQFVTAAGEPLAMGLVSDYLMPASPGNAGEIAAIFQQYLGLLDGFGLRRYFEPVDQRVTLSTHAGAMKPEPRVFQMAIERIGRPAALAECLFITEEPSHIAALKSVGMKTLRFGATSGDGVDFSDWAEAPLLIAHLLAPQHDENLHVALRLWLNANRGWELADLGPATAPGARPFTGQQWVTLDDADLGAMKGVRVRIPGSGAVELSPQGRVRAARMSPPSDEALAEAVAFVKTLMANQQLSAAPGVLPPGATHVVASDAQGQRTLQRRRFSAT